MKRILLTKGYVSFIDDEDYDEVSKFTWIAQAGSTLSTVYATKSGDPWLSMHYFIMRPGDGLEVDHINHNGIDNQRHNLRVVTRSMNHLNRQGVKGYYWDSARGKWYASIMYNYQKKFLGRFELEEDAANAYQSAKNELLQEIFGK